ncbi:MAG TPA: hypothetical protein VJ798_08140 [Rhizomicrobium sp.]|nr:hypothetical protein [Rhizomicrobium sp.]
MIRKAAWTGAVLGLLLGLLHLGFTLPIYKRYSLELLWFAGSGLAIVCCALMNLAVLRDTSSSNSALAALSNLLIAIFFAAVWPLLPGPQVAVGFVIFGALAGYFAFAAALRSNPP